MPHKTEPPEPAPPDGQVLIYQDGATRLQVRLDGRTVWLTQGLIAELFQTTKQNVSLHLRNIFAEHELEADSVVKESLTTAADGKRYRTLYYSLDAMLEKVGPEPMLSEWSDGRRSFEVCSTWASSDAPAPPATPSPGASAQNALGT
jgi:hypothetical protein